jgi:uncharacterized Zn finger protein (UPF0148 family)
VPDVTAQEQTRETQETAAAAATFLAGQEITYVQCRECGTEVAGVNGRFACGICGWSNPWHEGHRDLPSAEDDPDWPGRKQTA